MKCRKCNSLYEGKVCPNCGARTFNPAFKNKSDFPVDDRHNPAEVPAPHKFRLLGFRSGKPWKMVISIFYLGFYLIMLSFALSREPFPGLPASDMVVQRVYDAVLLLMFISPYICLSESKLRDHLPLFKKGRFAGSTFGMVLVLSVLFILSGVVADCYSLEYKAHKDHHDYEVTETRDPTCTRQGKIKYRCSICADSDTEWIDALGHDYSVETTTEKGKKETFCSRCGDKE